MLASLSTALFDSSLEAMEAKALKHDIRLQKVGYGVNMRCLKSTMTELSLTNLLI